MNDDCQTWDIDDAIDAINAAVEQGDESEVRRLYALAHERDDVNVPPIPEWILQQWKQGGAS